MSFMPRRRRTKANYSTAEASAQAKWLKFSGTVYSALVEVSKINLSILTRHF